MKRKKRKKHSVEWIADKKALKEWAKVVKERAGFQCEWCGRAGKAAYLNSHHIVSRKFKPLRLLLENGICLCAKCHKFGILSAHNNPVAVVDFLLKNRPEALLILRVELKKEE